MVCLVQVKPSTFEPKGVCKCSGFHSGFLARIRRIGGPDEFGLLVQV